MNLSVYLSLVLLVLAIGICNCSRPKFNLLPNSVAMKDMEQQTTPSAADNKQDEDDVDS